MKLKWFGLPVIFSMAMFSACNSTDSSSMASNSTISRSSTGSGGPEGATDFYIASFTPNEELPSSTKYPSIQIQFSEPVVALEKLGEPITKTDIVSISPKLNGVFRWYGTSLLSFDCTDSLIPQKEYLIQINPDLKSAKGTELSGNNVFSFHTEELKMLSVQPGYSASKNQKIYLNPNDIAPEYSKDIAVKFSNKVNPEFIEQYLAIRDEKSKSYNFKTSAVDEKTVLITLDDLLPKNQQIEISLKPGAMPDKDCWPTSDEQRKTFHTLRPFTMTDITGTSGLAISFNHRIKDGIAESILNALSFKPKMEISKENISVSGNVIYIENLPVEYGDKYSFSLAANTVQDAFGQIYEKEISKSVSVPDADSYFTFRDYGLQILESQFEPKRVIEFQNISSEYTLTAISGVTDKYSAGKKQTFKISPDKSQKNKRIFKTVDLKDFLEKVGDSYRGAVFFEHPTNRTYSESGYIQVTDLGLTVTSSWNKTDVLVASYETGAPVKNAVVSIFELPTNDNSRELKMLQGAGTKLVESKTDSNGLAELYFDTNKAYSTYRYIEVKTDSDRVVYSLGGSYVDKYKAADLVDGKILANDGGKEIEPESISTPVAKTKIFSDRGLYKPGEKASFKIIDRNLSLGQYETYRGDYEINFVDGNYWRRDRKVYGTLTGTLSEFGTASAEWELPEDLAPGAYFLEYKRKGAGSGNAVYSSISVQFFERVRFQASAQIAPLTYFAGDSLSATISASYLGGGSLAGGNVRADWTRYPTSFYLPDEKFQGYTFGPMLYNYLWDFYKEDTDDYDNFHEISNENMSTEGTAHVSVATGKNQKDGTPYVYNLSASVTDAGNQMIGTNASATVHPASFYIGISNITNVKGFPKKNEKLNFDFALVTPEGESPKDSLIGKSKKISWELLRSYYDKLVTVDEWGFEHTSWQRKAEVEQSGTESIGSKSLTIKTKEGGQYLLRMKTEDSAGRAVITEKTFYVTGSDNYFPNQDGLEIQLTADKERYEVGDTAHILMNTNLEKGTYLVTIEREGIIDERILTLNESSSVIDLDIKEDFVPVVWIGISTFSPRKENPPSKFGDKDIGKPKYVYGSTNLTVSTKTRTFDIDVKMDKPSYLPGSNAKIDLTATKDGKSLSNAELTLMVVDRGVLDLLGYKAGSPVDFFYAMHNFNPRTSHFDSRTSLATPVTYGDYELNAKELEYLYSDMKMMKTTASSRASEAAMYDSVNGIALAGKGFNEDSALMEMEEAPEDEDAADEGGESFQIRKDFRATAVFLPSLVTDENGKVSVDFKLPDSLTEYVVTVVGVKENTFAYKEESLTVANPISVRDVETRILRPGDNGEAGVVITNIGDKDETVTVDFAVLSGLEKTDYERRPGDIIRQNGEAVVSGESKKSIVVKSGDTQTLMFSVDAKSAGWITLSFTVRSAPVNEIIYKGLEIEKPYIYETVTTVGQIDHDEKSAEEKIIFPATTDDGRGTFYVQLDSSRLGTLRTAVDYVFHYPYGCLEQRSSAIMPLVAFGDYISVLGLSSKVDDAKTVASEEIAKWGDLQKKDGGFPYWPDGSESSLAVSLRIGEIIALASEHKIPVSSKINKAKLVSYIKNELKKLDEKGWYYPRAYSYYVMARLGEKISTSDLTKIIESTTGASEYAFAGLAAFENGNQDTAKQAAKKIKNLMALTTRGVSFQTTAPWESWYFYNSDAERYALALHLFTKLDAEDLYNGHLVWQILELEKSGQGRWQSTATTSRVLIALDSYIRANDLTATDFSAEALLNGKSILDGKFKGLGAEPVDSKYRFGNLNEKSKAKDDKFSAELPKLDVPLETSVPLEIKKDGDGILFYTASMTYAIPAAEQKARDEGLCVYVEITDARTGEKVEGNKLESGKIYKEKVYVTTTKNRTFVAVRAPVPAGAEILNSAFETTASVIPDDVGMSKRSYNYNWRISHQDIYDAEIRCFWNSMPIGNHSFEFMFRAQRSGEYESPAVLAECMYEPEIFGRSNGKRWTIK